MREIWTRIVQTSGTQGYVLLTALISLTVTARWLGPEGRGTVAAVTTWVLLFGTVGHLSLGPVTTHRATVMGGRSWLAPTLGSVMLVDALVSIAGCLVAATLFVFTSVFQGLPPLALAIGFAALPFVLWEQHGGSLLLALDRVGIYNTGQVAGRTISVLLVLIAWRLDWGVGGALVAALAAQITTALFGIRLLLREADDRPRADRTTIVELLKGSVRLHGTAVAGFVVTSVGILIINHSLGSAATGQFHAAIQLITVLSLIPQATSTVMTARAVQQGPNAAWDLQKKVVMQMFILMTTIAVLAAAVAGWIIPLVLGARFEPAVHLFRILLIGMAGTTLVWGVWPQWIARGMFVPLSLLVACAGVLTLVGSLMLVPRFGINAAASMVVVGQLVVAAGQVWMILHCDRSTDAARRVPVS